MPVSREQFDADLEAERQGTADYIAAVDAFITNPQVVDFAAEDSTVNALLQAVNDAKGRIPIPPSQKAGSTGPLGAAHTGP
jgi:hypothetical protein